jgi:hypothetical protein
MPILKEEKKKMLSVVMRIFYDVEPEICFNGEFTDWVGKFC